MTTDHEIKRLRDVYRTYRDDSLTEGKWSESNPGNRAILQERQCRLRQVLANHDFFPLTERKILDLGCGTGQMIPALLNWGALPTNLFGLDLLDDRILIAKRTAPDIFFQIGNAEHLSFRKNFFDLVMAFTVFSSILDDEMAINVAEEISRVLKPDGAVVWYDFIYNNPYNSNVRGVTKQKITTLFPQYQVYLKKITLLPIVARRLNGLTNLMYPILTAIPWLRTHYLGLIRKPVMNH
jgi:ubiquinone/menaquinone biosynthesis C-methylase UbiE